MSYFTNFPNIIYKFGDRITSTVYQDLSLYVDVIDQLKDQSSFYRTYQIKDGELPDQVSMTLYNTPFLYWTFEFVNDKIRESGWPLSGQQLLDYTIGLFPHTTLVTRDSLTGKALTGYTVEGNSSGATGVVVGRRLDFGQIIIDLTSGTFQQNEFITATNPEDGVTSTIELTSVVEEYNSIHHWRDSNNEYVDVDPVIGTSSIYTPVTFLDRYEAANDELKEIRVIKPSAVSEINNLFQQAVRS